MSSLRGEQALKDGLSFEFTWTARYLIEILEERALAIQLGGLPSESGVDFRVEFRAHEEHHQVKRAFGTSGEWKLSNLAAEGVLGDFRDRLANPRVHCHFVSSLNANQLGYLADRARRAENLESYRTSYLTGNYAKWFAELVRRWSLSEEECLLRLKRVFTRVMDERDIETSSLTMLRSSVEGSPPDVWVHLRDYCFSHLNQPKRSSDLWQWLETKGYKRQVYAGSPRILESLTAQTGSYLAGIRQKLIKPPFARQISATITGQLVGAKDGLDIVVLGAPGGGKSAVMLEITDSCVKRGWPVLAFRLDELSSNSTASQMQAALNLPVAPAQAISLAAAGRPALVVIDQLDAVSHYSGRTSVLFDRVSELVQEIRGHRLRSPIHVLIACRDIDWKHDGRFRQIHRPRYGAEMEDEAIHKVEELADGEISSILKNCGLDAAAFSPRQYNELLRRPQYLALFIEANVSNDEISKIVTPKQLFDAYWRTKERAMAQVFPGASTNHWSGILKLITHHLSETALKLVPSKGTRQGSKNDAPLAVASSILGHFPPTSIDWMITNGVIVESGNRIRFGHESLFDYCFARFFEERGQSLLEYLCQSDQTLIQRGQLRQVMAYMRDDDPESYVATAKELLDSEKIRPHLKLLLTVVLCAVTEPSEAEWNLICTYLESAMKDIGGGNTTTLACHVFYAFHGSLPFFEKSVESGAFSRWLSESGPQTVDRLFRVLLKHQETAQQKVWQLIAPLLEDERFNNHIEWFYQFCKASESRETFDWLLTVMRKRFETDDGHEDRRDRFYSLCEDLEKHKPIWLAEWIAALIDARTQSKNATSSGLIDDHAVDSKSIQSVAEKHPREFVAQVLPAVIRAFERHSDSGWTSWRVTWEGSDDSRYVSTEHVLLDSLTSSLSVMLTDDFAFARKWLQRLSEVNSTTCRTIHAAVLCNDHPACVEMVVEFLTTNGENLAVSYGGHLSAAKMIGTYSCCFSDDQLARLEATVLNYYPSWQNGYGYGNQRKKGERPSCVGTYRGYGQMNILRSFSKGCLSGLAVERLEELERKFNSHLHVPPKRRNESEAHADIFKSWKPQRYFDAILAKEARRASSRWPYDFGGLRIHDMLREAVKGAPKYS
ncbi:MAG: hypothetical protein ACRCXD_19370 [Luteolibacter sp.]